MWPQGIPLGEFGLLCVPVFGVERVRPVCHGAVTHRRERRSCCEPAAAASALADGSPDFWLRGAARAVSPRRSDGCCQGARVPGPRLLRGTLHGNMEGPLPSPRPANTASGTCRHLDPHLSYPSTPAPGCQA